MYQNHKVISTTPAGRKRYLEILVPYLLRNRPLIDEHHFWQNTGDAEDIAYLEAVCAGNPDFFKLIPPTVKPKGSETVSSFFTAEYSYTDVLYLRFDDDICYLAPDAVETLLAFRLAHREHFLVFANIVNNAYIDHLRQRMMLVEFAPFIAAPNAAGNAWKSPRFAEAVHWTFHRHHRDGKLDAHKRMFDRWICFHHERVSLNCFAWLGQDLAQVEVPEDEEYFLTRIAPKVLGRPNAICGGALVCHFAFKPQRAWLEKTDLLGHYKTLSEGGTLPVAAATTNTYPVEKMAVAVFTCDRSARSRKNYINETLANLARATEGDPRLGPVEVVIDGCSDAFVEDSPLAVRKHPFSPEEWEETFSGWELHRRIAYSYHRCFTEALKREDCCGVLVCEDDVDFRAGFLDKLQQVLDEIAADGRRWFILSLYTVGDLDGCAYLDMGALYGIYPETVFWGGQGVFFSRDVIELAMAYWARCGWRDVQAADTANDMLVGRFGHGLWRRFGDQGGFYRAYRDLVQHKGDVTSISGYYHCSETFTRPWPDAVELEAMAPPEAIPVLVSAEEADLAHMRKPKHIALVTAKAYLVLVPGVSLNPAILRIVAGHLGLASDAVYAQDRIKFPCFKGAIPSAYRGFAILGDPVARFLAAYSRFNENSELFDALKPSGSFYRGMTLRDFVAAVADLPDAERPPLLRSQTSFLRGRNMCFVGRAANFAEDFTTICRQTSIAIHSTVTPALNEKAPEPEAEAGLREAIRALYVEDAGDSRTPPLTIGPSL